MGNSGYESLHNHTTASDGTQTYLEALKTAEATGFSTIAFTDHDMLPDDEALHLLESYRGPVRWHIGCEITSGLPRELGGGVASMFHIVGLFVDPHNSALRQHCKTALSARIDRMQAIVANLRTLGFAISVDDCMKAAGGESVGRPHIVRALLQHPENQAVIDGLRSKMRVAAEADTAINRRYQAMLKQEPEKHAYTLFLSDDSFVPGIYVDYTYWTDMDKSVRLIRDGGGVAILAHWPTIKNKLPLAMVGDFLRQGRLDGLEVASGFIGTGVSDDERAMQRLADETGCLQTIGIDAHRKEDYADFVRDKPTAARASVGQTAKLFQRL